MRSEENLEMIEKYKCEIERLHKEIEEIKDMAEHYRKEAEAYQQQCIEINNLNVALDVMTRKYIRLRDTIGMDYEDSRKRNR